MNALAQSIFEAAGSAPSAPLDEIDASNPALIEVMGEPSPFVNGYETLPVRIKA